jgi:hypothetical protein
LGVALGASVEVSSNRLGVSDGVRVGVDDGGKVDVMDGWEVCDALGAGWMNGFEKHTQDTATKRMNIIIK